MTSLNRPARVLLVAGETPAATDLQSELQRRGFETVTTATYAESLPLLERLKLECMLLELREPDGYAPEMVASILRIEPRLVLVLMAPQDDTRTAVLCLRAGAADYLVDTEDPRTVVRALQEARDRREARESEEAGYRAIREELAQMTASLMREKERVRHLAVATLESLVFVVEARDAWLAGHSLRVAEMAACLAAEQGRTDAEIEAVRLAGRLHDIGMISLGDGILSREGPLTPEEFEQVKRHVLVGAQILAPIPQFDLIGSFVRSHHERWDGQGYPDGLAGESIPWGARLIAAAEIYDALTTARPYRETMTPEDAVRQVGQMIGTIVSPAVYDALRAIVERHRALVFLPDSPGGTTLAGAGFRFSELTAAEPGSGEILPVSNELFPPS